MFELKPFKLSVLVRIVSKTLNKNAGEVHKPVPGDGQDFQSWDSWKNLGARHQLSSAASLTLQHPPAGGRDEIRGVKNSQMAGKNNQFVGCSGKLKMEEEKAANRTFLKNIFGGIAPRCEFQGGKKPGPG